MSTNSARSLVELLDLQRIDRDFYWAVNEATASERLFGGQVFGQALRAAAMTVAEDRMAHSCHGYFLRPGTPGKPILLRVERDRDGRSFSVRHVVAVQDGEEILTLSASFHREEPGAELQPGMPADIPGPETVPADHRSENQPLFDMAIVPVPAPAPAGASRWPYPTRLWVRAKESLPTDPVLQICVLAYVSDMGNGFWNSIERDIPRGGATLDHAVWFHQAPRADDWMLLDLTASKTRGAREMYHGSIYDRSGRLLAVLAQEMLARPV
ncbi:MAG TPA: acyl-CoA thioesterase domain-containing protein [Acidimicrobiales bacterium]|nr:acyl-CoA thioesterase domain-containing protein [Acidimicrobiales bacterium]